MSDQQDFLSLETRKVLNALGNAGSIIEWFAVTVDGEPIVPEILGDGDQSGVVVDNAVVVVWPDETATLITTATTNDPR